MTARDGGTRYIRAPRDYQDEPIPRATARDGRISFRALGVLVRILTNADGFPIDARTLSTEGDGRKGRDAVTAALDELHAAGYISELPRPRSAGGRFCGREMLVAATAGDHGGPEKPATGFPAPVFQGLKSRESNIEVKALKKQQQQSAAAARAAAKEKRAAAATEKVQKRQQRLVSCVTCWTTADVELVKELISIHGDEAVRVAASHLRAVGIDPLPSAVAKVLREAARIAAGVAAERVDAEQEAAKYEARRQAEAAREARRIDPRARAAAVAAMADIAKKLGAPRT